MSLAKPALSVRRIEPPSNRKACEMIKLNANLAKKQPLPGVEFSSVQAGASLEVEIGGGAGAQEVSARLREMYGTLERSVDEQLQGAPRPQRASGGSGGGERNAPRHSSQGPPRSYGRDGNGGSAGQAGNGRRRGGMASQAQIKAVFAIARDRGVSRDDLVQILQGEFGADRPDDLDVGQASELIGMLQGMERARR